MTVKNGTCKVTDEPLLITLKTLQETDVLQASYEPHLSLLVKQIQPLPV